jgi:hypothetical protein
MSCDELGLEPRTGVILSVSEESRVFDTLRSAAALNRGELIGQDQSSPNWGRR